MNANLDKIAQDLYGKIRTRFSDIQMGDENAEVLSKKTDIPKARFFEFEYDEGGETLGTIAITLDDDDGIVIQVSGDLVNDDDNTTHHGAYKFIRGFRQFAKDRLLNFDVQNIGKSNLDKRDYEFQAKRKEEPAMPAIMENKLYGNNRMSYQDLGEARLVIKHSQPINLDLPAGRTMHIESIYIENAQGERFKYPAKHINGARALAEHIKHGGNPYDAIGKHICGLSEELASLRKFKGYVSRQEQLSEAMANVTTRVMERIEEIKKTVQHLQRPAYYEEFAESFEAQEEQLIPEEVQNDLIDRLTIRTFNEELKSVFPYIAKFVNEAELPVVELSADDLLDEAGDDKTMSRAAKGNEKYGKDGMKALAKAGREGASEEELDAIRDKHDKYDESMLDPESAFESFLEDIVREEKNQVIDPNRSIRAQGVEKMNELLSQNIQVGQNGDAGVLATKGLIDEPSFVEAVRSAPAETDLNDIIKGWVSTEHEDLLSELQFPQDDQLGEPAAEPAPAPAPEPTAAAPVAEPAPVEEPAPVAEGSKEDNDSPPWDVDPKDKKSKPVTPGKHGQGYSQARHLARQGLQSALKKAKNSGATLETVVDFGSGVKSIQEILDECGMTPADVGYDVPAEQGLPAMLKYVSGFYNRDEGNFPLGGQRIKIKVKKAAEDGEFGDVSEQQLAQVLKFIDSKDPSGNEHNQIMRLAGVKKESGPDITSLETQMTQTVLPTFVAEDSLARIISLSRKS